jgi:hypothetical protein
MNPLLLILVLLPGESDLTPTTESPQPPSIKLLEYIGGLEQDEAGMLLYPLDRLSAEKHQWQPALPPVKQPSSQAIPYHEAP